MFSRSACSAPFFKGFHIQRMSNDIFERVVQYDAFDNPHPKCGINSTVNAGTECTISIQVDKNLTPPILIYYQIENFHQNHRKYQKSRDLYQVRERNIEF